MFRFIFLFSVFLFSKVFSLPIGNPSDPGLYFNGLFTSKMKNASIRASYLYNNIYNAKYQDKLILTATPSDVKMRITAGVLTFNFFNRIDLLGILGTTDFELDTLIFSDRTLAWGAGLKLIIYKGEKIDFSLDGKYFSTKQRPTFFLVEKAVYPLVGSFKEHIEELNGSFALSYKTNFLIPYIGATFLYSRIVPKPLVGYLLLPDGDQTVFATNDSDIKNMFGVAAGVSIINRQKNATLNLETRVLDQNAFAFIGSIRF